MMPDTHNIAQQKAALHALIDTIDSPQRLEALRILATDAAHDILKDILPTSRPALADLTVEERIKRLEAIKGTLGGPVLSAEQLRRVNMYEDD